VSGGTAALCYYWDVIQKFCCVALNRASDRDVRDLSHATSQSAGVHAVASNASRALRRSGLSDAADRIENVMAPASPNSEVSQSANEGGIARAQSTSVIPDRREGSPVPNRPKRKSAASAPSMRRLSELPHEAEDQGPSEMRESGSEAGQSENMDAVASTSQHQGPSATQDSAINPPSTPFDIENQAQRADQRKASQQSSGPSPNIPRSIQSRLMPFLKKQGERVKAGRNQAMTGVLIVPDAPAEQKMPDRVKQLTKAGQATPIRAKKSTKSGQVTTKQDQTRDRSKAMSITERKRQEISHGKKPMQTQTQTQTQHHLPHTDPDRAGPSRTSREAISEAPAIESPPAPSEHSSRSRKSSSNLSILGSGSGDSFPHTTQSLVGSWNLVPYQFRQGLAQLAEPSEPAPGYERLQSSPDQGGRLWQSSPDMARFRVPQQARSRPTAAGRARGETSGSRQSSPGRAQRQTAAELGLGGPAPGPAGQRDQPQIQPQAQRQTQTPPPPPPPQTQEQARQRAPGRREEQIQTKHPLADWAR
jgi:hypothetical protein